MFLSKLFKRKSTKLVALLGAFSMMFGVGTTLSARSSMATETTASTGWYMVGSGSFVTGDDWSNEGGIELATSTGNKGALKGQFLQSGDIFKITNSSRSSWSSYANYKSGGSYFSSTGLSSSGSEGQLRIEVQYEGDWWGNDGCKTRIKTSSTANPAHDQVIDLDGITGLVDIYADCDSIKFYRYNKDGEYNETSGTFPTDFSKTYYFKIYARNGQGSSVERYDKTVDLNILVNATGYYNIYLNNDSNIYIDSIFSGEIYLNLNGNNWTSDNRIVCAHFWENSSGTSQNIEMKIVNGHGGSTVIFGGVVPLLGNGSFPDRVLFYRSVSVDGAWDNQTGNLQVTQGTNVFKLNSYTTGAWDSYISLNDRASYFGAYFNTQVICDGQGGRTTDNWSATQTEYLNMSAGAQGIVWTSAAEAESSDPLKSAMSKYDDIIYKHGKDRDDDSQIGIIDATHVDYVNRHINEGTYSGGAGYALRAGMMPVANSPLTTTLWIVLGAGLAGLAAIGTAYFVSKKKKYRA